MMGYSSLTVQPLPAPVRYAGWLLWKRGSVMPTGTLDDVVWGTRIGKHKQPWLFGVTAFWVDGQSVIFNHQPINIMLVKIEIGTPDRAGAKHLETICIAEEGSINWDYFEDLAKVQGKVIVDSYVEA